MQPNEEDLPKLGSKIAKLKAKKSLFFFGSTYMLIYSSYTAVIGLQSSIYIEDGLGAKIVSISFVVAAFSNLFVVPFVIDFFGAKVTIIAGEISSLLFIVANFYPSQYTLIPAAVIDGLIGTSMSASGAVYVSFLADNYWVKYHSKRSNSKEKSKETNAARFYAFFYAIIFTGDLISSILTMITLLGFQNVGLETRINSSVAFREDVMLAGTESPTLETTPITYEFCGSKECLSDIASMNATEADFSNFKPNPISIYILLSICVVLCVIGVVCQCFLMPGHPGKYQKKEKIGKFIEQASFIVLILLICLTTFFLIKTSCRDEESLIDGNEVQAEASTVSNALNEIWLIVRHLISPKHLLVITFLFYSGMCYGFIISDFARAYVSCIVGVKNIGVMYITLGVCNIITSALLSQIISRIGEKWLLPLFIVTSPLGWLLSLFWTPTAQNTWVIYLITVIFGISTATLMNTTTGIIVRHFPDILPIAFSGKNCIESLGISFIAGWTLELCVSTKLYMLIGFMLVSLLGIMGAEMLKRREMKTAETNIDIKDDKDDNTSQKMQEI